MGETPKNKMNTLLVFINASFLPYLDNNATAKQLCSRLQVTTYTHTHIYIWQGI